MSEISVGFHALDRFRERFPELNHLDGPTVVRVIRNEVLLAVAHGRMSPKMPRFCLRETDPGRYHPTVRRNERRQSMRYVWSENEDRVYLIDRQRHSDKVVTVIRPACESDTGTDARAA